MIRDVRALVVGAGGMLGRDLVALAPAGVAVEARTRAQLDVADADAVAAALDAVQPDWLVNASAYTQVDQAEREPDAAMRMNGDAVARLGTLCAARGVAIAHFGTDYVFAGQGTRPWREGDACAPLNVYGRSKRAGEEGLAASGARALVLRTQWLYGLHGRSFPRTMWERATRSQPARVIADQRGAPTATPDLARATWALVEANASGTLHVANAGEATWFDVAQAVYKAAGAPDLVTPCTTADYPTPAPRPAYSVLDTSRLRDVWGITMRPWREPLAEFCEALRAAN